MDTPLGATLMYGGPGGPVPSKYGRSRFLRRSVKLAVDAGVAHDGLDVFPGLGKRDRLNKLVFVTILSLPQPVDDAVRTGIVGGERIFEGSAELVDHAAEVARAEFEVHLWGVQLAGTIPL